MASKKTRIVARVDQQYREIFSIAEASNGGLTIIRRGEDNSFFLWTDLKKGDDKNKTVQDRISIHPSQKSILRGTTITETTETLVGMRKHAAYIKDSRNNLLWLAKSCLCPDLRHSRYEPSEPRKRMICVADDVPPTSCLMYHIFAADRHRAPVEVPNAHLTQLAFKTFQIFIYVNFLNLPATPLGMCANLPTNAPAFGGVIDDEHSARMRSLYPDGSPSMTDTDVARVIHTVNQSLFVNYVLKMNEIYFHDNENLRSTLMEWEPIYTKFPMTPDTVVMSPPPYWNPPISK